MTSITKDQEQIHETVRERYAGAALTVLDKDEPAASGCCGPSTSDCCGPSVALEPLSLIHI